MIFLPERSIFFEINTKMKSRREKNRILCVKIWRRTIGRRIKFQPGIYSPWNINYFCFGMFLSKKHGFGHRGWLRTVRYFLTSVFIGSLGELNFSSSSLILGDYGKRCETKISNYNHQYRKNGYSLLKYNQIFCRFDLGLG